MDIPLENTQLRAEVSSRVREIGRSLGKQVIEVETNIRSLLDAFVPWTMGYGAVLRTTALLLDGFSKFYIPGSHYGACLCPDGTHPLLDPLWSTAKLQFVHDGCETTRFRKCELVSRYPLTYEHLRVCWQNRPGAYNCCRCEKCVRTMVYLRALDRLEHFSAFPKRLKLRKPDTSWMTPLDLSDLYRPLYTYLQKNVGHPELVQYVEQIICPSARTRAYHCYKNLRKGIKHGISHVLGKRVHGGVATIARPPAHAVRAHLRFIT
jgi:hypothetical protein